MISKKICFLIVGLTFIMLSCNKKEWVDVLITSESERQIYVEEIKGFSSSPAGGFFIKDKKGSSNIDDNKKPLELVIYWNFSNNKKPLTLIESKISVEKVKHLDGQHDYIIIFNKDDSWICKSIR